MNRSLPIFACVVLATTGLRAQTQTATPRAKLSGLTASSVAGTSDSISGDALLRRVLAAADAHPSISAKVRQKVEFNGISLRGTGIYRQQGRGPGRLLRFDLELETTGGQPSTVQQICDGKNLWIFENVTDFKSLSKVDVSRLRAARPKASTPTAATTWLGLGGLPALLTNLDAAFRFGPVAESRLGDLPVWTLSGTWDKPKLLDLLPDQKVAIEAGQDVDLTKLPANLPDRVVLHVGCDDFFPYRLEYWRLERSSKDGKVPDHDRMLVVMEFYEVQLGGAIDPREFVFRPSELQPVDRTQAFMEKLGLQEVAPAGANQNQKLPARR